jgi:hypothetical protein
MTLSVFNLFILRWSISMTFHYVILFGHISLLNVVSILSEQIIDVENESVEVEYQVWIQGCLAGNRQITD